MFVLPSAGLKQIHLVHSWVKLKDICSFSGMHTEFSSESKTYMARNPDNVSEWGDMSSSITKFLPDQYVR